jgi:hypothetical protein
MSKVCADDVATSIVTLLCDDEPIMRASILHALVTGTPSLHHTLPYHCDTTKYYWIICVCMCTETNMLHWLLLVEDNVMQTLIRCVMVMMASDECDWNRIRAIQLLENIIMMIGYRNKDSISQQVSHLTNTQPLMSCHCHPITG